MSGEKVVVEVPLDLEPGEFAERLEREVERVLVLYKWRRFLEEGGSPEGYEELVREAREDIRRLVARRLGVEAGR